MSTEKVSRTSLRRSLTGVQEKIVLAVGIIWMLIQVILAAQIIYITPQKVRVMHLGFAVVMVFLLTPITKKSDLQKFGICDAAFALFAAGVFAAFYMRKGVMMTMGGRYERIDVILGIIVLVLLYEAARRVASRGLLVLSLITLAYVFWGNRLSGGLAHTGFTINRIIQHLSLSGEGVFGFALGVTAETIVVFVIFGAVLQEVGISDYFYDLSNAIAGKQKGGPAKVAVISSSLMGMVSGETSANVATTGAFTIPLMKRVGYDKNFAGAVECAASAGGQILPPVMGATAFMLADTLGIPYIQLAIAAILPAVLYYVSVFSIVHFRAVRLDLRGNEDEEKCTAKDLLKRSYLLLPLIGIVVLLLMNYTPTFAAFWGGIGSAVVISFFRKETRLNLKKLVRIASNAAKTTMSLGVACAVVGVIVGAFSLTGISMTVARLIFQAAGGSKLLTLVLTMIVAMILGMGLPTSAAYVLCSISAVSALTMCGLDLLPAHLFVFYFGCMSTITPPVATGAYAAAGLSGGNPNIIGFNSMKLAMAGFIVPFVFIYQPDLLLRAGINMPLSLFTFAVTAIGLVFISAALEGALFESIPIVFRVFYGVISILLLVPSTMLSAVGLAAGAVVLLVDYRRHRKNMIVARAQE